MEECCRQAYIRAIEDRLANPPDYLYRAARCSLCAHRDYDHQVRSCRGCPANRGFCEAVVHSDGEELGRLLRRRLSQLKSLR